VVAAWERAWDTFVPFLQFDAAIRKVIYTTNAIVILSPKGGRGCDLGCFVEDSVLDGAV
jgi:transposase-like protein